MAEKDLQITLTAKDEASSKLKAAGEAITGAFKKISIASSAALVGIGAFAVKSVKDLAGVAEEITNLSKQTGVTVAGVQALRLASDQSGISLEAMAGAIKKMQLNLVTADADKLEESLGFLNLKFNDIANLKPEEQFFEIGNEIAKIQDPMQRTAMAVDLFGKSGTDVLAIFGDGATTLQEWTKKAEEMGVMLDSKTIEAALKADDAFDNFDATVKGIVQTVAVDFLPVITQMVEEIKPVIQNVISWMKENKELTIQIGKWTLAVLAVGAALGPLITVVGALGTALTFLAANPIVLIIGALVAMGAAVVSLYKNNEDFRNAVEKAWNSIKEIIGPTVEFIYNVIKGLIDTLLPLWKGFWDDMVAVVTAVKDTIVGVVDTIAGAVKSVTGAVQSVGDASFNAGRSFGKSVGSAFSSVKSFLGFADGGRPQVGVPSVVGERGPELFVPDTAGTVIPNGKWQGGGTSIYITGNTLLDDNAATKMGDMILKQLRYQIKI